METSRCDRKFAIGQMTSFPFRLLHSVGLYATRTSDLRVARSKFENIAEISLHLIAFDTHFMHIIVVVCLLNFSPEANNMTTNIDHTLRFRLKNILSCHWCELKNYYYFLIFYSAVNGDAYDMWNVTFDVSIFYWISFERNVVVVWIEQVRYVDLSATRENSGDNSMAIWSHKVQKHKTAKQSDAINLVLRWKWSFIANESENRLCISRWAHEQEWISFTK